MASPEETIRKLSPSALRIFKQQAYAKAQAGDTAYTRVVTSPELADIFSDYKQSQVTAPTKTTTKTSPAKTALNTFMAPFNWIGKNITEPFGAVVTSPFTKGTQQPGESWLQSERRQYEQVPGWVKFGVESIPWLIPSIVSGGLGVAARGVGAATTLGKGLTAGTKVGQALSGTGKIQKLAKGGEVIRDVATGLSRTAKAGETLQEAAGLAGEISKFGKAGQLVGKAVEWSPWGIAEKATGAAISKAASFVKGGITRVAKPVAGIVDDVLEKSKQRAIPTDEVLNQSYKQDSLRKFNQWAETKPALGKVVKSIFGETGIVNGESKIPIDVARRQYINYQRVLNQGENTIRLTVPRLQKFGKLNDVLSKTEAGLVDTAIPHGTKTSKYIGDILDDIVNENGVHYTFSTPQSKAIFDEVKTIVRDLKQIRSEEGLKELKNWHRAVKGIITQDGRLVESKFGSDPSLRRLYDTQEEAVLAHLQRGEQIVYETDLTKNVASMIETTFRQSARKRLTDTLKTLGATEEQKFANLYPEKVGLLESLGKRLDNAKYTQNTIQKMISYKGQSIPGATLRKIRNELPEVAAHIDDMLAVKPQTVERIITAMSKEFRAVNKDLQSISEETIINRLKQSTKEATRDVKNYFLTDIEREINALDSIGKYVTYEPLTSKAGEIATKFRMALEDYRKSLGATNYSARVSNKELKKIFLAVGIDNKDINSVLNRAYSQTIKAQAGNRTATLEVLKKELLSRLGLNQKTTMADVEDMFRELQVGTDVADKVIAAGYKETQKANQKFFDEFATANRDLVSGIIDRTKNELKPLRSDKYKFMSRYAGREAFPHQAGEVSERIWNKLPEMKGVFMPDDVVTHLEKYYGDKGSEWIKTMGTVGTVSRSLTAVLDDSAPFVQGLFYLGRDPIGWARATGNQFMDLIKPQRFMKYMSDNSVLHKEMAKYGIAITNAEQFQALPLIEQAVSKVPGAGGVLQKGIKATYGRAETAYNSLLQHSRDNMWLALKQPGMNETQLQELGHAIGEMTGDITTRQLGLRATQRDFESAFVMFSPNYTSASLAFVGNVFKGGITGDLARRSIGQLMAGGMAAYIGVCTVTGQKPELNPQSSKFMTIEVGNDRIGIGGMTYSLARLAGNLTTVDNPTDLLKLDRFDNPFVKFMYGKAAPLTGMLTEFIERKNYLGEPFESPKDYVNAVLERVLPFGAQPLLDNDKTSPAGFGAQLAGMRQFPESVYDQREDIREKVSVETFKQSYKALPRSQRNLVNKNTEIQSLTKRMQEEGRDTEDSATWDNYNSSGQQIEDYYQRVVSLASQEYKETGNGAIFKDKIDGAKKSRRDAYAMREKLPEFATIQEYYNKPKTPLQLSQMNPLDMATDIYYKKMFAPDMYDQYGNYDFDKADQVENGFVQTYGQDALDEVESLGTSKWAGTPEMQELNESRKLLQPYFQIETQVWNQYPPELKQMADQIAVTERTNERQARQMLFKYPQIVYIRKQIALLKQRLKRSNPQIAQALNTFYAY